MALIFFRGCAKGYYLDFKPCGKLLVLRALKCAERRLAASAVQACCTAVGGVVESWAE